MMDSNTTKFRLADPKFIERHPFMFSVLVVAGIELLSLLMGTSEIPELLANEPWKIALMIGIKLAVMLAIVSAYVFIYIPYRRK